MTACWASVQGIERPAEASPALHLDPGGPEQAGTVLVGSENLHCGRAKRQGSGMPRTRLALVLSPTLCRVFRTPQWRPGMAPKCTMERPGVCLTCVSSCCPCPDWDQGEWAVSRGQEARGLAIDHCWYPLATGAAEGFRVCRQQRRGMFFLGGVPGPPTPKLLGMALPYSMGDTSGLCPQRCVSEKL